MSPLDSWLFIITLVVMVWVFWKLGNDVCDWFGQWRLGKEQAERRRLMMRENINAIISEMVDSNSDSQLLRDALDESIKEYRCPSS